MEVEQCNEDLLMDELYLECPMDHLEALGVALLPIGWLTSAQRNRLAQGMTKARLELRRRVRVLGRYQQIMRYGRVPD